MPSTDKKQNRLQKSLALIFVYTVATGSIFTYVSYWDSVFFSYCGPGTFLAFALMTLAILPIALVYSEISSLFHTAGGELIYNTVGFNRHVGFLASWLIMAAWISVPPAVVMAIVTFISRTFGLGLTFGHTMIISIIILVAVFLMSMQDIQFLVKAQAVCLFANITTTLLTGVLLLFSGHWSFANVANLFQTNLEPSAGIPGWIIGMALLITPFFGFETVPQMVEEDDFPTSNTKKAICGSVLTCGTIYVFFFFVAGLDSFQTLLSGDAQNGFMTITAMQNLLGISLTFILLQNATTFMNDFFNLMSFGCACAYALTMVSAVRIHRKHPEWYKDNKNVVKGGDFTRILAMVIMLSIAFFCTLGQGRGPWISFGVYMGVGVVIWLWMVAIRWKKSGGINETPDGEQQF